MIKTLTLVCATLLLASLLIYLLIKGWVFFARELDEDHRERLNAERALREAEEDLERAINREEAKRKKH